MELLQKALEFWNVNAVVILGVALAISEALALIPGLKANSILQFVINALKSLSGKKDLQVLK